MSTHFLTFAPRRIAAKVALLVGLCPFVFPIGCQSGEELGGAAAALDDTLRLDDSVSMLDSSTYRSRAIGDVSGQLSVGTDGSAAYTVPLAVPPGRAGMQPSLALRYSSRGANGIAGVGWSLQGASSSIARCPKNIAANGVVGGIEFTDDDALCLDGAALQAVQGTSGRDGAEYRTFPSGPSRVVQHGDLGAATAYFEIFDRNGTVHLYGQDSAAKLRGPRRSIDPATHNLQVGAEVTYAWYRERTQDSYGNFMTTYYHTLRYTEDVAPGACVEMVPDSIAYTGHADIGGGNRYVVFEYELRPDPSTWFVSGFGLTQRRRLKSVASFVESGYPTSIYRQYALQYRVSTGTNRTLLDSVTEKDGFDNALTPKRFQYQDFLRDGAAEVSANVQEIPNHGHTYYFSKLIPVNVDDEVLDEFLALPETVILSSRDDQAPAAITTNLPPQVFAATDLRLADFDDDDRPEFFLTTNTVPWFLRPADRQTPVLQFAGYLGAAAFTEQPWIHPSVLVAEMNGDARKDVLALYTTSSGAPRPGCPRSLSCTEVYLRTGAPIGQEPFSESTRIGVFADQDITRNFAILGALDLDQSGKDELVGRLGYGTDAQYLARWKLGVSGLLEQRLSNVLVRDAANNDLPIRFMDVNGDGLPDVVRLGAAPKLVELQLNTGTGFGPPRTVITSSGQGAETDLAYGREDTDHVRILDANRDGRDDFILFVERDNVEPFYFHPPVLHLSTGSGFRVVQLPFYTDDRWAEGVRGRWDVQQVDAGTSALRFITSRFIGTRQGGYDPRSAPSLVTLNTQTPDVLVGVSDGATPRNEVVYTNIAVRADSAGSFGYTPTSTACEYPQRCPRAGLSVVSSHTEGESRYYHAWSDARFGVTGQGFMGFASHRMERSARDNFEIVEGVQVEYDNRLGDSQRLDMGRYPKRRVRWTSLGQSDQVVVEDFDWTLVNIGGDSANSEYQLRSQTTNTYERPALPREDRYKQPMGVLPVATSESRVLARDYDGAGYVSRVRQEQLWYRPTSGTIDAQRVTDVEFLNRPTAHLIGLPKTISATDSSGGDSRTRATAIDYDSAGGVKSFTANPGNLSLLTKTVYDRSTSGVVRSVSVTGAVGDATTTQQTRTTTYEYDSDFIFPVATVNALGHRSETHFHRVLGRPTWMKDPNGAEVATRYDGFGRVRDVRSETGLVEIVDLDDTVIQLARGVSSYVRQTVTSNTKSQSETVLDLWRRPVRIGRVGPDGYRYQHIRYDSRGRAVLRSLPTRLEGFYESVPFVQTEFDNLGRPTRVSEPVETEAGQPSVHSATYSYVGLFSSRRQQGAATSDSVETDSLGRIVRSLRVDGADSNTMHQTEYSWGAFSSLLKVQEAGRTIWSASYDDFGVPASATDGETGVTTVSRRNAFGELVFERRGLSETTTYSYDELGRVTESTGSVDGLTRWFWDPVGALGQLDRSESPDATVAFEYEPGLARTVAETHTIGGESFRIDVGYDEYGRLDHLEYPESYETGPRLKVRPRYDFGQVVELLATQGGTTTSVWEAVGYDDLGNNAGEAFGDGTLSAWNYSQRSGRLESIVTTTPSGTIGGTPIEHQRVRYGYRPDGLVSLRADDVEGSESQFGYDLVGRLTSWTWENKSVQGSQHGETYRYDHAGRMVERNGIEQFFGAAGAPFAFMTEDSTGHAYEADDLGRVTQIRGLDVSYTQFDLPRAIGDGADRIEFGYGPTHERVRKDAPLRNTVYVGGLYEREEGPEGTRHSFHLYAGARNVANLVYEGGQGSWQYLHTDGLGSVDIVTSRREGAAEVDVERLHYDPWGRRVDNNYRPVEYSGPQRYGFTGHEHDDELGLINARGRLYDPAAARFLTPDPILLDPFDRESRNPYSYVYNAPTSAVDPTGFCRDESNGSGGYGVNCGGPQEGGLDLLGLLGLIFGGGGGGRGQTSGGDESNGGSTNGSGGNSVYTPPPPPPAPTEPAIPPVGGGVSFSGVEDLFALQRDADWSVVDEPGHLVTGMTLMSPPGAIANALTAGLLQQSMETVLLPSRHAQLAFLYLPDWVPASLLPNTDSLTYRYYGPVVGLVAGGVEAAPRAVALLRGARAALQSGELLARVALIRGLLTGESSAFAAAGSASHPPVALVRRIAAGELWDDVVAELATLQWASGNEHALISLTSGERLIVAGGRGGGSLHLLPDVERILAHTHPPGNLAGPSPSDYGLLVKYEQRSSWLIEQLGDGTYRARRFFLSGWYK